MVPKEMLDTLLGDKYDGIFDEPQELVSSSHLASSIPDSSHAVICILMMDSKGLEVAQEYLCSCSKNKCTSCLACAMAAPSWILDSGASSHFSFALSDFSDYFKLPNPEGVTTARCLIWIVGQGTIIIDHMVIMNGKSFKLTICLHPVMHIPNLTHWLLSLGSFPKQGMCIHGNTATISLSAKGKHLPLVQAVPHTPGDMIYWMKCKLFNTKQLHSVIPMKDYNIMNQHFGHLSKEVLHHALDDTKGFPKIEIPSNDNYICPGCAKGKIPAMAHPKSESYAEKPFEKIHSDLKRFPVISYYKYKYFIPFLDDYTSFIWIVLLHSKGAAINTLKQFLALLKNQYSTTPKEWMSDAGGKYKSDEFICTLKDNSIKILQSIPHLPQQNGHAECFMHTILDKSESLCHAACIPDSWWEFSMEYALHIYNRTPPKWHSWKTPYELLNGEQPNVSHLKVFGCSAYVHLPKDMCTNKLSPKSELMCYLGPAEGI